MSAGRHIAVLFHHNSIRDDLECSVVYHFAGFWRAAGHRVTFLRGTKRFVPADLLFVHVNLSLVPDEYLDFAGRYPAAVNHRAKDIRKSSISESLVRRGEQWDGAVIVKSDLNYGGQPEFDLAFSPLLRGSAVGRGVLRFKGKRSPFSSWRQYPIFDHIDCVPERLARDPRIVIERFQPEIEDGLYRLRVYQFLGDRASCRRLGSPDPLVRSGNSVIGETIAPDPIVDEWRRRLRLDYGKLDYVVHDGRPVLLDVNKTTGTNPGAEIAERDERRRFHAAGIESFFA